MSLSVNVIVRDGVTPPSDIVRAIRSIADIADEIVVVDTGSTDGTISVLRGMLDLAGKMRVFRHRWRDDFAEARNYALDRSNCDWIMWLDDDEEVPKESVEKIGKLIEGDPVGYIFFLDGPELSGHTPQLRLFPRVSGARWRYAVHEQIAPALIEAGIRIEERPDVRIYHYGYSDPARIHASWVRNGMIAKRHLSDGEWYEEIYRSYLEYKGIKEGG